MKNIRLFICAIVLVASNSVSAEPLTILAIKGTLEGVIESFRQAMHEGTEDIQSIGNSLQSSAQNVLADIDRLLGKKLEYTVDKLEGAELRLVEDAQELTRSIQLATEQIIAKGGEETRTTIVEADILAYNTSYSLPCRDSRPRVVASFPSALQVGQDVPKLTLKGNFLRQGDNLKVLVNDVEARVIERLDSAISVEIPKAVLQTAIRDDVIVSVKVENLEEIGRSLWLWGLLGCHENTHKVSSSPIGLTVLEPPFHYELAGSTHVEYTAFREAAEPAQSFANTGSDRCDDNYRVDRQWCISGAGSLVRADVSVTSANCHSAFEGTVPSGNRCVLARGKVGGCGADRGPFNTWLGCKGRGWLKYNITLVRREPYQTSTSPVQVSRNGVPGELSFTFDMATPPGLHQPKERYSVQIKKMKGSKLVESLAISHANPNVGQVASRVNGGVLAVEIRP
ncbi:MAG: hypothetical protein H6945_08650 [Zoogloeaceae bacterium]|nr:hypothetical protein [Rhodocyclaceae bacterium]MCP5235791.1 hypothetical protein [Zoogloeaceae bacterium]